MMKLYLNKARLPLTLAVFSVLLLLPFSGLQAQLNQGGTPLSFDLEDQHKNLVSEVRVERMPAIDLQALQAEDRMRDYEPGTPFRFGENIDVQLNPQNSGALDEIKGGTLWRVGISSPGARSINLLFDEYHLPEGATLFIYNKDRSDIIGAFTHENNQDDGFFATTLVAGDEIVVEYYEPADAAFEGSLNIGRVTHGYRAYGASSTKDLGASGSCNLNVACEEADGWENEISSAARMVVGGNSWCSGQMINNTSNDGTPYFLSANHCYTNPGQVVLWFNYESDTCDDPSTPPEHDAISGATDVARNAASDFWLMELNQAPPADYGVYLSGWNRTTEPEVEGYIFGVHHPSGDIKKFSYLFDGVTASDYLGATGSGDTHWRVGSWADGTTTEPGSSGSALFDGNGLIIGQLHGGYAACGNTLEDWYGRIGVSWDGGGSPNSRLSDWLDPAGTGVLQHPGYNPNEPTLDIDGQLTTVNAPRGSYSVGEAIVPSVTLRNAGIQNLTEATISYEIDNGMSDSITWEGLLESGQTETIAFPEITVGEGEYEFDAALAVEGDENPDNNTASSSFRVFDCSAPTLLPFTENFDAAAAVPDCWEVVDNHGSGQVWQVGTLSGTRGVDGTTGNYAYLDSDAFGSGNSQDSDLITPALDLSNYADVELSFTHYFRQFQTSTATVSYSIDGGESWTALESWTDDTPNPAFFSQAVPEVDGQSEVHFKWNYEGSWDWYWSVDDIEVTGEQQDANPAMVQLLHNAADPALSSVDVYVNDELAIEDFEFRSSLAGVELPAGTELTLGVAAVGSEDILLSMDVMLEDFEEYLIIVNGVGNPDDFTENPDGHSIAAEMQLHEDMFDAGTPGNENLVYVYHGVTDAPAVDISLLDGPLLIPNLGYGEMHSEFLELAPDSYMLELTLAGTGERLFVYEADISTLENQVIGIVASGFVNPDANHNGAGFSLLAVLESGEVIGLRDATSSDDATAELPSDFALEQNYPNPFNPTTNIEYALPEAAEVTLEVFNLQGQRVATLVNGQQSAGRHTVSFDAANLSSGVYLYRIQAGSFTQTQKMLLLK